MLVALIGPRLHAVLDDIVVALYLLGALALELEGAPLLIALGGAAIHFTLARITDYPRGWWPILSFRTHAFVELGEGLGVLASSVLWWSTSDAPTRVFMLLMGASQIGAFLFSDYRWPVPAPARA